MRNSLVNSGALSSRDSSVVDDGDGAPTTILGGGNAGLTVRVDLARIVNSLTLFKRDLAGDQFKNLLSVPLADLAVQALHESENVVGGSGHGSFEGVRSRSTRSAKSPGEDGNLRTVEGEGNTLHNAGRSNNPQLSVKVLNFSGDPNSARGLLDGDSGGAKSSVPFALGVTLVDLKTTVISDENGRGVVVSLTSLLTLGQRRTSTTRTLHALSVLVASVQVVLAAGLARVFVGTLTRSSLVASPGAVVAQVCWWETLGFALSQRDTFTRGTAGNAVIAVGVADVTVASLVLVILGANPFLETRRRVRRIFGLSSAVRSLCSVFVDDIS